MMMDRKEVERILNYCEKATQGPWMKSLENANLVSTVAKTDSNKREPVFEIKTNNQAQAWHNMKLIINARHDLPSLAKYSLELLNEVDELKEQLNSTKAELSETENKLKEIHSNREHQKSEPAEENSQLDNILRAANTPADTHETYAEQFNDGQAEKMKFSSDVILERLEL